MSREAGPVKGGKTVIAFVDDPTGYKFELIQREKAAIPEPLAQVCPLEGWLTWWPGGRGEGRRRGAWWLGVVDHASASAALRHRSCCGWVTSTEASSSTLVSSALSLLVDTPHQIPGWPRAPPPPPPPPLQRCWACSCCGCGTTPSTSTPWPSWATAPRKAPLSSSSPTTTARPHTTGAALMPRLPSARRWLGAGWRPVVSSKQSCAAAVPQCPSARHSSAL